MERLRVRDLRHALGFLGESYRSPDHETFARHAVRGLLRLIPADRSSYSECHPMPGRSVCNIVEPETAPLAPRLMEAWSRFAAENPVLDHYQRTGDENSRRFSDFVSQRTLHRLALYNEYYRHVGVEHQILVRLTAPRPLTVGFALSRVSRDFTDRDRLMLNMLRPHLVEAQAHARAAGRLRARLATFGRAMDAVDLGVVLLTRDDRIELVTRRARHWLRQYLGPAGTRVYTLPSDLAQWVARQRDGLQASDDIPSPREPFRVTRGDRQLTVRLVDDEGQRVLLLEEHGAGPDPGGLAILELTWRESEVLAWLAYGKSNEDIAAQLGASPRTIAKHVEHIYRKLGVDNRAAAAAKAFAAWRALPASAD